MLLFKLQFHATLFTCLFLLSGFAKNVWHTFCKFLCESQETDLNTLVFLNSFSEFNSCSCDCLLLDHSSTTPVIVFTSITTLSFKAVFQYALFNRYEFGWECFFLVSGSQTLGLISTSFCTQVFRRKVLPKFLMQNHLSRLKMVAI